jgi:uncharacterized protein YbjT (DUF2867 family)
MAQPLILSVGADGRFAGMVVAELVRRGASVRGMVHKPENVGKIRARGVAEAVTGDLRDPKTLAAALKGVESAFYIAPAFLPDEAEVGIGFVTAAKEAGVRRIVFSSVIHPILAALQNHLAKYPVENAILESGMEYTFLQPAMFFQNYAAAWPTVAQTGVFAEPYSAERPMTRVDYRDVAEAAAVALTEDRLVYGTFQLCAEGNLSRHDVASLMAAALGRKIHVETLSFDEWVKKTNVPHDDDKMAELKKMYDWYDAHSLLGSAVTLRAILGREPRSLREYFVELNAQSTRRAE